MTGKDRWWEGALRKFEPTLPEEIRNDLDYLFAKNRQNNEEEDLHKRLLEQKEAPDRSRRSAATSRRSGSVQPGSVSSIASSNGILRDTKKNDDDEYFQMKESEGETPQVETRNMTEFDKAAKSRQQVRFNAVTNTGHAGNKASIISRSPSAIVTHRNKSIISGFFENTSYSTPGGAMQELEDDDPFYEIFDCHKVTYIEKKLLDPLNKFQPCEFAKEEIEDYIKEQINYQPPT